MNTQQTRHPCIVSSEEIAEKPGQYPNSEEVLAFTRRISRAAGLERMAINIVRVPPGHRTSWPHAEEKEEEFVYVLEGTIDAWIDGTVHAMRAGDFAGFPAGTGLCHSFINNGDRDAKLLVGGDLPITDNRIYYPLHPQRRGDLPSNEWWDDIPLKPQGPHDGMPDALRRKG